MNRALVHPAAVPAHRGGNPHGGRQCVRARIDGFDFQRIDMAGCVELVSQQRVKGWAPHDPARKGPATVRVSLGDTVVAEGVADIHRADVAAVLKSEGTHGFDIQLSNQIDPAELANLKVSSSKAGGWNALTVLQRPARAPKPAAAKPAAAKSKVAKSGAAKPKRSYQDFDGTGGSKSNEKLEALRLGDLPRPDPAQPPLKDKAVLDIGCNEGFFCMEAVRQGARRVLGVDFKQEAVESARQRCPEAEFMKASWWDIPDEKFDVIFFLSAIHYEREQLALLKKLATHLNPNGVLVLECGLMNEPGVRAWRTVKRWDGVKRYPTRDYLLNDLLQDYAVRAVGRSVDQKGDPVNRYVFHCTPHQSVAMLIGGRSKKGKSSLSFQFEAKGVPAYPTDAVLKRLILDEAQQWRPMSQALTGQFGKNWPLNIAKLGDYLVENNLVDELCAMIVDEAPVEAKLFIIQGEVLRHAPVQQALKQKLKAKHVRAWLVDPL
ncbi:class I SAM-dependent methyltransferase [Ramlibacter sp. PS3R-8]|uniref:class I SAM-dependent methyltransferase n=1 Tax=Ramlibacter sp. PS3R-8 TaxID=3133437 RepID=UPI0030B45D93